MGPVSLALYHGINFFVIYPGRAHISCCRGPPGYGSGVLSTAPDVS